MSLILDGPCLSQADDDIKELESIRMSEHEQEGHIKKNPSCPMCQTTDAPVMKHPRVPHEVE